MTTLGRRLLAFLSLAVAPLSGVSAADPPSAGVVALADAERAFARLSVEQGVQPAFLAYFADDGLGFWPEPTIVRTELAKLPPPPPDRPRTVLDWYPILSDLAASGELGFNLGPAVRRPPPGDEAKPRHSYFFSVWKKQEDARFKVVLDMGIETGGPLPGDSPAAWRPLRIEPYSAEGKESSGELSASLRQADAALGADTVERGALAAYSAVLAADFRLFDEGKAPIAEASGAEAHLAALGPRGMRRFELRHAEAAASADFGYSWGAYQSEPAAERGYYAHVWRRDAAGRWRLAIEVIRPLRDQP